MSEILYETDDHVATITLNRPDRLNALTVSMLDSLADALRTAGADREVRAVVMTGAGRGFCAGTDLQELASAGPEMTKDWATHFDPSASPPVALAEIDTPVVAAVNGPVAGYGVGIALGADIRVMAADAKLVPATKRNLVPESGDTYLLPRLVGWERAARFYFLGEDMAAKEALELGVVSELAADSDATKARARQLADRIAKMPPAAVQAARRMMRAGRQEPFRDHVHHVLLQLLPLFDTRDTREAVAAWIEKREPHFTGE